MSERRDELAANLDAVRRRIEAAAAGSDRDPEEITLVAVTKFFPASDVRLLAGLGVTDVGENRHQEAQAKAAECADLDLRWHFIGGLQSNKAAAVTSYADVVESVDRAKLVPALDRAATAAGREVGALVQVRLDGDPCGRGRGGTPIDGVAELAERIAAARRLTLRGLMAVAPTGVDPERAFAQLATVARGLQVDHPGATWISAGMSADLEAAVANGATHLRVGSAILGSRPPGG